MKKSLSFFLSLNIFEVTYVTPVKYKNMKSKTLIHAEFKYQYFPLFNPITRKIFQVYNNQYVNILKYKQKIDHSIQI